VGHIQFNQTDTSLVQILQTAEISKVSLFVLTQVMYIVMCCSENTLGWRMLKFPLLYSLIWTQNL